MAEATLEGALNTRTREGELYEKLDQLKVRCFACGLRCVIADGKRGICKVRFNRGGTLHVPYGYVAGVQCDPIEKKPYFHVFPGRNAVSFGMLGCDLHCPYCQNWLTSQALRDPDVETQPQDVTPDDLVELTLSRQAPVMVSTYNEPLITSEWSMAVFKEARKKGIRTGFVSNGNGTPEVLAYIRPHTDFYKIDLKSFRQENYKLLGGVLKHITDTIQRVHDMGFWLEIVTLVVPGYNDDPGELRELTQFVASVSKDIPWHATAFHRDYKMTEPRDTTAEDIVRAAEIGKAAGLRYVYAGNRPGQVGDWENTRCPACHELLIERLGFRVIDNRLRAGRCFKCREAIPGVWEGGGDAYGDGQIRKIL